MISFLIERPDRRDVGAVEANLVTEKNFARDPDSPPRSGNTEAEAHVIALCGPTALTAVGRILDRCRCSLYVLADARSCALSGGVGCAWCEPLSGSSSSSGGRAPSECRAPMRNARAQHRPGRGGGRTKTESE